VVKECIRIIALRNHWRERGKGPCINLQHRPLLRKGTPRRSASASKTNLHFSPIGRTLLMPVRLSVLRLLAISRKGLVFLLNSPLIPIIQPDRLIAFLTALSVKWRALPSNKLCNAVSAARHWFARMILRGRVNCAILYSIQDNLRARCFCPAIQND
jgi:hypothetical protein